jgi:hypothetical protein
MCVCDAWLASIEMDRKFGSWHCDIRHILACATWIEQRTGNNTVSERTFLVCVSEALSLCQTNWK